MEKQLKPYYKRKNRAYYKHEEKKMIVEKESTGVYNFYGQIITDVKLKNPFAPEVNLSFPSK